MVSATQERVSQNPDSRQVITEYIDFQVGVELGLEAAELDPVTPETIDRAFTVRKLAFAAGTLSESTYERALSLLKENKDVRVQWNRELFDAAMALCAYYPFSDVAPDQSRGDNSSPHFETDVANDLLGDASSIAAQPSLVADLGSAVEQADSHLELQAEEAEASDGSTELNSEDTDSENIAKEAPDNQTLASRQPDTDPENETDSAAQPDVSPVLVATPKTERLSRRQQARQNAPSVHNLVLPTRESFRIISPPTEEGGEGVAGQEDEDKPRKVRNFEDLNLDEQREVVTRDVARAFGVDESVVWSMLSHSETKHFTGDEIHLLALIRERLCLQVDRKKVATSNGLLEPMKEMFKANGLSVIAQVANLLGLKTEFQKKKRVVTIETFHRPAQFLGKRSGNSNIDYRNMLSGVRYIALCTDRDATDADSEE